MIAEIHDALVAAGHDVRSVRKHKDGTLEVLLKSGDQAAADAACAAWKPDLEHKIRKAAKKRGLTPLQLAQLRIEAARDSGGGIPMWAKQVLRAERLGDVDAELQ